MLNQITPDSPDSRQMGATNSAVINESQRCGRKEEEGRWRLAEGDGKESLAEPSGLRDGGVLLFQARPGPKPNSTPALAEEPSCCSRGSDNPEPTSSVGAASWQEELGGSSVEQASIWASEKQTAQSSSHSHQHECGATQLTSTWKGVSGWSSLQRAPCTLLFRGQCPRAQVQVAGHWLLWDAG